MSSRRGLTSPRSNVSISSHKSWRKPTRRWSPSKPRGRKSVPAKSNSKRKLTWTKRRNWRQTSKRLNKSVYKRRTYIKPNSFTSSCARCRWKRRRKSARSVPKTILIGWASASTSSKASKWKCSQTSRTLSMSTTNCFKWLSLAHSTWTASSRVNRNSVLEDLVSGSESDLNTISNSNDF